MPPPTKVESVLEDLDEVELADSDNKSGRDRIAAVTLHAGYAGT